MSMPKKFTFMIKRRKIVRTTNILEGAVMMHGPYKENW